MNIPITEGDDFNNPDFYRSLWRQTTTTVALLTSAAEGRENVMACEWAMLVNLKPLRFVISVAPREYTHQLIQASGEFGLNFCSDQQAHLAHIAGSYSLHDVNKWELADFPTHPAQRIRAPMIQGCILNAECRVVARYELGDHDLFVGEALWARYDPKQRPLLYHRGKYWKLGEGIPKPQV
ncbi:MAG: flavin reductase [Chloroflexi bacterium]|nr:flavin reductase [Chloroflexota bacterium]